MILQLPNGKAMELSVEQYLSLSDRDLDDLNCYGYGDAVEDPWFGSVLSKAPPKEIIEEILEEHDLTTITIEEKLSEPDIDFDLDLLID